MSLALYINVSDVVQKEEDGHELPYKKAVVILNGNVAAEGLAPNFGPYKAEGTAESSAISRAQSDFVISQLCDIRGREEDNGDQPSWVPALIAGLIKRHTPGRRESGTSSAEGVRQVRGTESGTQGGVAKVRATGAVPESVRKGGASIPPGDGGGGPE